VFQIHDVSAFVGVFVVFLFSYGIAVQAILFPFQEPSWQMLINVVYQPFFHIYGQLFLEHYGNVLHTHTLLLIVNKIVVLRLFDVCLLRG
jgi:hypothetical protein